MTTIDWDRVAAAYRRLMQGAPDGPAPASRRPEVRVAPPAQLAPPSPIAVEPQVPADAKDADSAPTPSTMRLNDLESFQWD